MIADKTARQLASGVGGGRYHVARLLPRHFKILELTLAGHDPDVIAKIVECSRRSIGMIQMSPIFQAEISRRRKEAKESDVLGEDRKALLGKARSILEQATEQAAEVQRELLQEDNPSVRLQASNSILDRVFGKAGDTKGSSPMVNISADQVQLLVLAIKESSYVDTKLPAAHSAPAQDSLDGREADVHKGA